MKPKYLYMLVVAAGIGGGVTRGLMNGMVFDTQTGLMRPNHPLTWTLFALTVLAVAAAMFVKLSTGKSRALPSRTLKPWVIASCTALGVSGVLDITDALNLGAPLTSTILAALGILTAAVITMLITSGNTQKLTLGLFATVPIFWSCFWFLSVFADNSANPVMMSYLYEFLAVLFTMAAVSVFAGFYFGAVKTHMLGITVSLGLFFTLISLTAPIVSMFMPDAPAFEGSVGGILRLVFSLMYLAAIPSMAHAAKEIPDRDDDGTEEDITSETDVPPDNLENIILDEKGNDDAEDKTV
jgi:hypothetical protein